MDELLAAGERAGLPQPDVAVLRKLGWSVTNLATLKGGTMEVFATVVEKAKEANDGFVADEVMVSDMAAFCELMAVGIRNHDAKHGPPAWLEAHQEWKREHGRRRNGESSPGTWEGKESEMAHQASQMHGAGWR